MNKELNSIGLNKKPSDTTVVVAMSGGVDSSTVAAMMKNAPQPELASQFMDFILDDGFQSVIPTTNWMYPAGKASVPDAFGDLITPPKSLLFAPEQVAQNKSAWLAEWQGALSQ